jgi:hypothetical protein
VPTADEVIALMVGDGFEDVNRCDVVVAQQDGPFQCISKLHVRYMALHYPLLFPYGEDGWHLNIPLNGVIVQDVDTDLDEDHVEKSEHQRKHRNVTMAKFYSYRLQHRNIDGIVLFRGGRLRQQYIVDVYATIEQKLLEVFTPESEKTSCKSLLRPSGCHHYRRQ